MYHWRVPWSLNNTRSLLVHQYLSSGEENKTKAILPVKNVAGQAAYTAIVNILLLYRAYLPMGLWFGIWYSSLWKTAENCVVRTEQRIIGTELPNLDTVCQSVTQSQLYFYGSHTSRMQKVCPFTVWEEVQGH